VVIAVVMMLAGVMGYMIWTSKQSAQAGQTQNVFTDRTDTINRMIDEVDHPKHR
jgi:flagellar basal body-associated protein FliL